MNLTRAGWLLGIALAWGCGAALAEEAVLSSNWESTAESRWGINQADPTIPRYTPLEALPPTPDEVRANPMGEPDAGSYGPRGITSGIADGHMLLGRTGWFSSGAPFYPDDSCGPGEICQGCQDWCNPATDPLPCYGLYTFSGYDDWRNPGNHSVHSGIQNGFNLGLPVPKLSKYGIGFQGGLNYGAYNFNQAEVQQQTFFTVGFFRRPNANVRIGGGIVYDFMVTDNFNGGGTSPYFSQGRAQITYALTARNEIGFRGAWRDHNALVPAANNNVAARDVPVANGQIFWQHKFWPGGPDLTGWMGFPDWLVGNHFLHQMMIGGQLNYPLNDYFALYSNAQGLISNHETKAGVQNPQSGYDFAVGLQFHPAGTARSRTVAGRTWMPYMPVANNGNFMIDNIPR